MNKWQRAIIELIKVFGSSTRLVEELNKILGDGKTNDSTISNIKNGITKKVYHDLGQAILILHVTYIPDNNNKPAEVNSGQTDKTGD